MTTDWTHYFEGSRGFGVLATADDEGRVNAAVYARPHVNEDGTVAMIMADRRSHAYLKRNPHATFLFRADGGEESRRYDGVRLALTAIAEEQDTERLRTLARRGYRDDRAGRFLVTFQVDEVRPLVGDDWPGDGRD